MTLSAGRYYQEEAVAGVYGQLQEVRSTLVVMATGTGKTWTFSRIAKEWPGDVLVLVHRDELVLQAKAELEAATGEFVEIEKASLRSYIARIVVGSVQTLASDDRLRSLNRDRFSLIIVDEAHHYIAPSFRKPLDYFESAKILGVTATPDRGDGRALRQVFETLAYQFDIRDAIAAGYLVPLVGHREVLEEIDLSDMRKSAGDLPPGQLDEVIVKAVGAMVAKTLSLYPDRKVLGFFPGVRSAELAAEGFNAARPGSACVISGKTDEDVRRRLVAGFRSNETRILCNCAIATEGFDCPDVDLVLMGRPTLSRALYAQMVGRGTRVLGGTVDAIGDRDRSAERRAAIAVSAKRDCVILDFVGNSGKHDLAGVEDVLGGKDDEAVIKLAKKRARGAGGLSVDQALAEAREQLRRMADRAKAGALIRSRTVMFDPFAVFGGAPKDAPLPSGDRMAPTAAQRQTLEKIGLAANEIAVMSQRQASRFLDECFRRKAAGLATYKQMKLLRRYGVERADVTFDAARAALDFAASTRFVTTNEGVKRKVQYLACKSLT